MNPPAMNRRRAGFVPRFVAASLVICSGGALAAQEVPPGASQPDPASSQPAAQTTWLRVIRDDVNIRSRADTSSVPVIRVNRGEVLRAFAVDRHGWYRIEPPEGLFSYVSADHVELKSPTEGVVTVQSGTLRVRVGSLVEDVDPLQSEVQTLLERGTTVRVLGRDDAWLKIAPPRGVYVYIAGELVERITEEEAHALRVATPSPRRIQAEPGAGVKATTRPRPASGPDLTGSWGQRLLKVEESIEAEQRKDLLQQDWITIMSELRPIAAQAEEPMVAHLARAWLAQLEERVVEQQTARAAEELLERAARERAQQQRERQHLDRARESATRPIFEARGALRRSYAVEGRHGRRWYRLVDPVTQTIQVYLEFAPDSDLNPEAHLGQYVGVRGTRRTEDGIGADILKVIELVVLGTEPASQPVRGKAPAEQQPQ